MNDHEPARQPSAPPHPSPDLFRLLVDSVKDSAMCLLDPAGRVMSWNAGAESITGYRADEAFGRPFEFLYSPEARSAGQARQDLDAALARGTREWEGAWRAKDGSDFRAACTVTVLREGDRHAGFAVVLRDATERERSEELRRVNELGLAALEHSWDVISFQDPDGVLVYQSPSIKAVLGYDEHELLGKKVLDYVHPDDAAFTAEKIAEVKARPGARPPFEARLRHKNGEWRWCECTGTNLLDHPVVRGILLSARDVTDRRRVADELRRSERRSRTLVQATSKLIWTATPAGDVIPPDEVTTFSGRRPAQASGWGWVDSIHPDDRERATREWREAVAAGRPLVTEVRVRRADGAWRRIGARVVPVRDDAGRVEEWVGVGDDVTELRQTEEWLRAILDSAFNVVITTDERGVIISANTAAEREFGYAPAELVGRHVGDLFDGPRPGRWTEFFADDRGTGRGTVAGAVREETGRRRDGSRFPAELTLNEFRLGEARRFTAVVRDVSERRQAEHDLRLRDRAIRGVSQGILITDPNRPDNPVVFAGGGFERLTGYRPEEAMGRNCRFLQGPNTDPATVAVLHDAIASGQPCSVEIINYRKDGTPFWNALSVTPVRDDDGRLTHFVGIQSDVTERRKLEEQLAQSQKMDAVGRLAGGVAHDFNNLLTVITGYSDLLLGKMRPGDPQRTLVAEIRQAGERAAGLTRQLLAFSRKQVVEPVVLDLNDVVAQTEKMLRRLVGEDVVFTTILDPNLCRIKADPGQIDQVLMNLVVNARDAMPTGGRLTVETRDAVLAPEQVVGDAKPGRYALLSVSDTGQGMTEAVKARIFEPFFTTKEPGKGTGLGLAVVHGIVMQSHGHIAVCSEVGVGTTFKLYFPVYEGDAASAMESRFGHPLRGGETVLLVEDEEGVRRVARIALESQGYVVLSAAGGEEAVRLAEQHAGPIHLVVTDVVMPEMGGRQLADTLRSRRPGLKVLFMSGYTDDAVIRHGIIEAADAFLQKPFTPLRLAKKVRAVLDGGR